MPPQAYDPPMAQQQQHHHQQQQQHHHHPHHQQQQQSYYSNQMPMWQPSAPPGYMYWPGGAVPMEMHASSAAPSFFPQQAAYHSAPAHAPGFMPASATASSSLLAVAGSSGGGGGVVAGPSSAPSSAAMSKGDFGETEVEGSSSNLSLPAPSEE
jgi:hypothetical protein